MVDDRVDEAVDSEVQQYKPRSDHPHRFGELQPGHAEHARQEVRKEETDEADQNDHDGAGWLTAVV